MGDTVYGDFLFCQQITAYDMRISDWSSDVCSSDLETQRVGHDQRTGAGDGDKADLEVFLFQRAAVLRHCLQRPHGKDGGNRRACGVDAHGDRKSVVEGTCVSVRVDIGGRRINEDKKITKDASYHIQEKKNTK